MEEQVAKKEVAEDVGAWWALRGQPVWLFVGEGATPEPPVQERGSEN